MAETVKSTFRVKAIDEEEMIVKNIQKGTTTFVETTDRLYDDNNLWGEVQQLSKGDVVTMTLEAQNPKNTIWLVSSIESVE